jgi:hypothetical protein
MKTISISNPCLYFVLCPSSFTFSIIRSALNSKKVTYIPFIHTWLNPIILHVIMKYLCLSVYRYFRSSVTRLYLVLFGPRNEYPSRAAYFLVPRGLIFNFLNTKFSKSELPISIPYYFISCIGMLYNKLYSSINKLLGEHLCPPMS